MIFGAEGGLHETIDDLGIGKAFLLGALALRDGWAVRSDLTTDASSYAPVPLPAAVSATGSRKPVSGRVAHAANSPMAARTASADSGCRGLTLITIRSSTGRLRAYQAPWPVKNNLSH